jgi:hypothetical protein
MADYCHGRNLKLCHRDLIGVLAMNLPGGTGYKHVTLSE